MYRMLTIIYITFREHCRFEWFIEPLLKSIADNVSIPIQIVVVDGYLYECSHLDQTARRDYFASQVGSLEFLHVSPKPTKWQGAYRLTKENFFAAANTRNTGACYAKYNYIAFIDDLGIIAPTWLSAVLAAMQRGEIHCGAYTKVDDMVYQDTLHVGGHVTNGRDHRLNVYSDDVSPCPGQHMYGSSFCLPKDVYFQLNGQNEMHDSNGGEDYDFGIRLERAHHKVYYNKRMFIHESNTAFGADLHRTYIRCDPVVSEGEYTQLLREHQLKENAVGRRDMSHFMLANAFYGPISVNPEFSLEEYNTSILRGDDIVNVFRKPTRADDVHFFTKKPISDGFE